MSMSKEEASFKNRDRFIQLGIVIAAGKIAPGTSLARSFSRTFTR